VSRLGGLLRQAGDVWEVPRDLLLRRYPPFVTGGALPHGHVPVFVFHSLEPLSFGRQLEHLAENGYVTLSATEYLDVLENRRRAPERAVLLTFDDARGSLWTVGHPLLRKHGMRGVVFVVPARLASRPGPLSATWDDVEKGQADAAAVLGRESADGPFLSWEEVRALDALGVLEFQSHSLTHAQVHSAPRLAGFLTPALRQGGYAAMDVPLVWTPEGDLFASDVPLGTPLLTSTSRLGEAPRFFEALEWRERALAAVRAAGGKEFFARADWRQHLREALGRGAPPGRWESPAEQETAMRRELSEAREQIEAHTRKPVVHLCYPWHVSSPLAQRLAREVGYRSTFWGKVPGIPLTAPGGDLSRIARVGEDYVLLLPGRGRQTLGSVLRHKWTRRLRGHA
jgi:peptidoglycan/xylan/chitin deacetylase (PgdA/CDA1 family)